jgi:chaperonin GroES
MPISPALAQPPTGLSVLQPPSDFDPEVEFELDDPEAIDGEDTTPEEEDDEFGANLAEKMDNSELVKIAGELLADYDEDQMSRKDWLQTYVDGIELLGVGPLQEKTEPWPGCCSVTSPLLLESIIKFQAEIMQSSFPAMGPCKTKIIGKETQDLKDAAERVQDDINTQIVDVMVEYRAEHEKMLFSLGLCGNSFKKVYYDTNLGRQVSMFVSADDVVVPYGAASLESSERITHVMRKTKNDVNKLIYAGFYRDVELGEPSNTLDDIEKQIAERLGFSATQDDRFKLLEMQVNLDLDDFPHKNDKGYATGIELPYIVTIEKGTTTILAIRRNWDPDDTKQIRRNHFVHYGYIPAFGFYNLGLVNLIGSFAKSGTSLIRQLVDAGTLSNLPGGFKANGLRVKGDDTPIGPGEWRDVDVPSGTLRDNFMPLPYKEPSQTLFQLLQAIVEEGRKFAGSADLAVSDMSSNSPVGTTLAVLERTLKMMSAIQARIHYSMKRELQLLRDIIRDYTPQTYSYEPEEGGRSAKRSDYKQVAVIPVSDPNAATLAQRVVQYQAVLQLAQGAPQLYDMPLLHRQMLEVLGIKDYQKLIPMPGDAKPRDPVTENQDILKGKPVKAFLYQDHQAHITVHMAAMHDPKVMSVLQGAYGNNPQALQALEAALSAHIAEHLGYEYRKQIEQAMGQAIPTYGSPEDEDEQVGIPMEIELQVSQLAARASQQLLQQNVQAQQAQENAAKQQDPVIQLQQQELQLKAQDLQRKAKKDDADIAIKQAGLQLQGAKLQDQSEAAGATLGANIHIKQLELNAKRHDGHTSHAVDIHKHHSSQAHDMVKHEMTLEQQLEQAKLNAKKASK